MRLALCNVFELNRWLVSGVFSVSGLLEAAKQNGNKAKPNASQIFTLFLFWSLPAPEGNIRFPQELNAPLCSPDRCEHCQSAIWCLLPPHTAQIRAGSQTVLQHSCQFYIMS